MKKSLLLSLFSLLFLCANAQVIPQENAGLESLKSQQDIIILNLDKHHKEYKVGWLMQLGGALLSTIVISTSSIEDDYLSFYGGLATIAGGILVLDSDKWFSRKNTEHNFQYNKMQIELEQLRNQVNQINYSELDDPKKPGLYYKGVKCTIIEKSIDQVKIKYLNPSRFGEFYIEIWVNKTELITVF